MESLRGAVIWHPSIQFNQPALYHSDGVHLSQLGNDLFLGSLQQGIKNMVMCGWGEGQARG